MLKKICPNCGQASYSSSEFGLWICPHCETSLRYIPAEPAEKNDDIAECFWCGERIAKFPGGRYICQGCGWEYKKESQAATESKEK